MHRERPVRPVTFSATAALRRRCTGLAFAALLALAAMPVQAADRVDPGTLTGKLIMGFQGWFACPGDTSKFGWGHWGSESKGSFNPTIDMLPDVSELPAAERCPTPMRTADGQKVALFTDQNIAPVELQFAWMQQYGLDGVAVQRFATDALQPQVGKALDIVLGNVRRAAEDHGRVFFVMYDLSGMKGADLPKVAQDWARLEQGGLTGSKAYQHHRGHPLLALWGLGFDGRPIAPGDAEGLLDALAKASAPYGGVTFFAGVPTHWRIHDHDASHDVGWDRVWRRMGVISPWSVGRIKDEASADAFRRDVVVPDMAAARAFGADYMPVIYPGFSIANVMRLHKKPNDAHDNEIPRNCGRLYWREVYDALSAGATMLYGAMFDEVNEGTAMFKVVPSKAQAPVQGFLDGDKFVTLDADGCKLPSDWYLRLAGAATTALHSHAKPPATLPFPLPSR